MQAQFVLAETDVPWFIGAADIITQRMKPRAPKLQPPPHANVSPTMQAHLCMGDYCQLHNVSASDL